MKCDESHFRLKEPPFSRLNYGDQNVADFRFGIEDFNTCECQSHLASGTKLSSPPIHAVYLETLLATGRTSNRVSAFP
jgi:hypothetical protein